MGSFERTVRYTAPVYITIKGDRVARVVVDDEAAEPAEPIPPDIEKILDTEEWPPWEFGF